MLGVIIWFLICHIRGCRWIQFRTFRIDYLSVIFIISQDRYFTKFLDLEVIHNLLKRSVDIVGIITKWHRVEIPPVAFIVLRILRPDELA